PRSIVGGWTVCDENAGRAEELGRRYIGAYWRSVVKHYELVGDHLTKMRGYEAYKEVQERVSTPGGVDMMTEFFLGLQVYGTPEQCYEKVLDIQKRTGAEAFNGVFSYGGMPYDLAESSLRLFASEVMPELKRHIPAGDQLIARAGVGPPAAPGSFLLYDRERDELVFSATETLQESALLGLPATGGPSAAGWAACTGESTLAEDERVLAVPLRHGARVIGALELRTHYDGLPFTAADRERLERAAAELANGVSPEALSHDAAALHRLFARVAAVVPSQAASLLLHDPQGR